MPDVDFPSPQLPKCLSEFLADAEYLHDREAMMTHRFIYDARLAFSCEAARLQVHWSEIDHDGFDVIFDDGDILRKLQLKTTVSDSGAWDVHRKLLLPDLRSADVYGYESSSTGTGLEGGVVLMKLIIGADERNIDVVYHYTDVRVLRAFELGIVKWKHHAKQESVMNAVEDLKCIRTSADRIDIPFAAFLRVKGITELLSLAGFHCGPDNQWQYLFQKLSLKYGVAPKGYDLPMPEARLRSCILREMLKTVDDPWLSSNVGQEDANSARSGR